MLFPTKDFNPKIFIADGTAFLLASKLYLFSKKVNKINQLCFRKVTLNSLLRLTNVALRFQIALEFINVGFWGEGKTGVPEENPLRARTRTSNKLTPRIVTPSPGIEPGPHRWKASALTTAPCLLPPTT